MSPKKTGLKSAIHANTSPVKNSPVKKVKGKWTKVGVKGFNISFLDIKSASSPGKNCFILIEN